MAGATGLRYNNSYNRQHEIMDSMPMFERMGSEEYMELQQCRSLIDSLQQRVNKLEKINLDLEYRLEDQAKQSMALEKECIAIDRKWKARCEQLEAVIDKQKQDFELEVQKGERVREHLSRTERELYGILQRKYELMRGPGKGGKAQPSSDTNLAVSWDMESDPTAKV